MAHSGLLVPAEEHAYGVTHGIARRCFSRAAPRSVPRPSLSCPTGCSPTTHRGGERPMTTLRLLLVVACVSLIGCATGSTKPPQCRCDGHVGGRVGRQRRGRQRATHDDPAAIGRERDGQRRVYWRGVVS